MNVVHVNRCEHYAMKILSVNHLSLDEVFVHQDYSRTPYLPGKLALWIQSVGNGTRCGSVCNKGTPALPSSIACWRLTPLSVIFPLPL
jgi:hypothetical protein